MGSADARNTETARGQTNAIAIVLVFALVVAGSTLVVVLGASAIGDSQNRMAVESAENALTKLDSQASLVALGNSNAQEVELDASGSSGYRANNSTGWMNVSYGDETVLNATLGSVTYENDEGTRVAYQGGGVWRGEESGGSTMVSPPEFRYRNGTLTLPLVTVANEGHVDGTALITRNHTAQHYPDESVTNPLDDGVVTIEVKSRYHDAWYSYLDSRTDGTVEHFPDDERVKLTLTVPITETFDNALGVTGDRSDIDNEDAFEDIETEVDAGSPDYEIQNRINYCEADASNCDDLTDGTLTGGTYYSDSAMDLDSTTFDTSGGDINVIVDGDLSFSEGTGGPGNEDYAITGDGQVTFYIKGDVDMTGNAAINTDEGAKAEDLLVMVHSDGEDVSAGGTTQFIGLIYAPESHFEITGGGNCGNSGNGNSNGNSCPANVIGSIIVESADGGGNGDVDHDDNIDRELTFESANEILYLHVSENSINVTDS